MKGYQRPFVVVFFIMSSLNVRHEVFAKTSIFAALRFNFLRVDWQVIFFGSGISKQWSDGQIQPGKLFNLANELEEIILIVLESSNSSVPPFCQCSQQLF